MSERTIGAVAGATAARQPHEGVVANGASRTTTTGGGVALMRSLVAINLGLVALQALSAGLFLSAYAHAVQMHAVGAAALGVGVLLQAVTATVLFRQSRVSRRVLGSSLGLLVAVIVQMALGHTAQFWLHVPLGIGIYGGLLRQMHWLGNDGQPGIVGRPLTAR